MELTMDYFYTIHELFQRGTFCDLKIIVSNSKYHSDERNVYTQDASPIFCHSIVLCAALPELKACLWPRQPQVEDHYTLILEGYKRDDIQLAIEDIYTELINHSGQTRKESWSEIFAWPVGRQTVESIPEANYYEQDYTIRTSIYQNDIKPESRDALDSPFFGMPGQYGDQLHSDKDSCIEFGETECNNEKKIPAIEKETQRHSNKKTKKIAKLRKIRHKGFKDKTIEETEKVCFGCLKRFSFSTCKERNLFSKHTLMHCRCECNISFKSKIEYEKHMKTAHKGHLYRCNFEECNAKSTLLKEYIRHRQKHIQCSKEESNICPNCGREFISSYYMKAHFGSRHKRMKCKICGVFTYGTDDNQKHHNAFHKPNLVCELCGKNFKTKSTLRCHVINVHTPEDQRPYKCDLCPKGFLNSRYLLTHVERDHKGNRAFTCRASGCERTFTLPEVRKRHEKRDHNLSINLKPGVTSKFEVHTSKLGILNVASGPQASNTSNPPSKHQP